MELTTVWFGLIAVLFTGYFILEGFDFGVGVLARFIGRTEPERRAALSTIGPVWDGNEVWLITAGGAMFAAFPEWYATLFSGFYLPLLLILIALILRGVALEYRDKRPENRWRTRWDNAILAGSVIPAALWGVAFANIVAGVPLDADHEYTGTLLTLLTPYALLGGATTTALFITHGAVFLALKTTDDLRRRARRVASWSGLAAVALAGTFLAWTLTIRANPTAVALAVAAALALVAGLAANQVRREGWAFTGTTTAIGLAVAALFATLFPTVLPSTTDPAGTLTTTNAASTPYTLTIMTWVAAALTPVVLLYQGWTYWIFRRRVSVTDQPGH
ncbi:cytochrome bd-I ubiquinol oxidase subunit 2 apoprotein [Micromonospora sp. Llam0]|uniref:cytochrome d ubiquinol oxidase subunit II n=1 Tax=Micromonospora sp. Llam0 TaxID=2485143 RepID=UPI000F4A79FE|nr:cytochrome d ubiquinol oxidase subunit II [Micromonospora sp. Llam0]ROO60068.1 cytochrome bd-I ubiquinol oxidase subunit 2 apoprotein [Micromonospora sp. Llam0]